MLSSATTPRVPGRPLFVFGAALLFVSMLPATAVSQVAGSFGHPDQARIDFSTAVEYGPVPFQKKNTLLWLPKSAEIYFDFRKHRYYRRHSFDHYMLFSTDTNEKTNEPVVPPAKKS